MVDTESRRSKATASPAAPKIEFLILADKAEVLGNKLYMMGGCWDRVQIPKFPALYPLAVAMRVRFPDNDPRDDHSVEVTIREGDSEPSVTFGYQLVRQSAPIGGLPLVAVFALPMIATMNTPGRYVVEAKIDTSERAAMDFLVEQSPASS